MLHQGEKFVHRFDANACLRILDAWQWFDLLGEAGAKDFEELFARSGGQQYLVFSIDSDFAFPHAEQGRLVHLLKDSGIHATWITVHSEKGHDSFLLEPKLYSPHIGQVLG